MTTLRHHLTRNGLRRALAVAAALPLSVALLPLASSSAATVHTLVPGQSLAQLLTKVAPGDTVVLGAGTHPRQVVTAKFSAPVRISGASRTGTVVQGLELSGGASNLVFSDLTVTTPGPADANSAIKVVQGANQLVFERLDVRPLSQGGLAVHNWGGAPRDIVLRDSVVDGSVSSGTWNARAVYVGDVTGADSSGWPAGVTVERNDMSGFWADIVHVAGATDMTVQHNVLRDLKTTDDHNDGLQSVASLRLRVIGNRITSPAAPGSTGIPPDQGIMLGHAKPATAHGKVVDTYVANNLIHHWRGKGVVLAGTDRTTLVNNTVVLTGPSSDRYAAPSLTVYGPSGAPQNTGVRIRTNALDRLWLDTATAPEAVSANCVTRGATGQDRTDSLASLDLTSFELSATSPCRDLGAASAEDPLVDRLGRVRDSRPDAGAHEVLSAGGTPTTPEAEPQDAPTSPVAEPEDQLADVAIVDCPTTGAVKAKAVLCAGARNHRK